MLIDAIARGGCPDTGGEFALKLTGRKSIPAPGTPTSVYFRHRVVERLEVSWKTSFAIASDRMKYAPFQLHVTCVMHNG